MAVFSCEYSFAVSVEPSGLTVLSCQDWIVAVTFLNVITLGITNSWWIYWFSLPLSQLLFPYTVFVVQRVWALWGGSSTILTVCSILLTITYIGAFIAFGFGKWEPGRHEGVERSPGKSAVKHVIRTFFHLSTCPPPDIPLTISSADVQYNPVLKSCVALKRQPLYTIGYAIPVRSFYFLQTLSNLTMLPRLSLRPFSLVWLAGMPWIAHVTCKRVSCSNYT